MTREEKGNRAARSPARRWVADAASWRRRVRPTLARFLLLTALVRPILTVVFPALCGQNTLQQPDYRRMALHRAFHRPGRAWLSASARPAIDSWSCPLLPCPRDHLPCPMPRCSWSARQTRPDWRPPARPVGGPASTCLGLPPSQPFDTTCRPQDQPFTKSGRCPDPHTGCVSWCLVRPACRGRCA